MVSSGVSANLFARIGIVGFFIGAAAGGGGRGIGIASIARGECCTGVYNFCTAAFRSGCQPHMPGGVSKWTCVNDGSV